MANNSLNAVTEAIKGCLESALDGPPDHVQDFNAREILVVKAGALAFASELCGGLAEHFGLTPLDMMVRVGIPEHLARAHLEGMGEACNG